jgi:2-methylcitrate dehydratase PrpD
MMVTGGVTAPALAALVNGTSAHVYDYDDTHIPTDAHFSGPTWSAVLALGQRMDATEQCLLAAFVTGFEVGAKLGGRRLGHAIQTRGFQPTVVLGRISSAAACAVLLSLDAYWSAHTLALAATQSGGLRGSFGTMAKPFQAGRAAMDGVSSAQMAADGFEAAPEIFEQGGGLAKAFVQDGFAEVAEPDFDAGWEILRNSFKPYPCLHGIHPSVDAAKAVCPDIGPTPIAAVRIFVGPLVPTVARFIEPTTPYEGKFSLTFCVALGLLGRDVHPRDFAPEAFTDPVIIDLMRKVEVVPVESRKMINAAIEVELADSRHLEADIPLALGHPGNPMSWQQLENKFLDLVVPELGEPRAVELANVLKQFPERGSLSRAFSLICPLSGL